MPQRRRLSYLHECKSCHSAQGMPQPRRPGARLEVYQEHTRDAHLNSLEPHRGYGWRPTTIFLTSKSLPAALILTTHASQVTSDDTKPLKKPRDAGFETTPLSRKRTASSIFQTSTRSKKVTTTTTTSALSPIDANAPLRRPNSVKAPVAKQDSPNMVTTRHSSESIETYRQPGQWRRRRRPRRPRSPHKERLRWRRRDCIQIIPCPI